MSPVNLSYLCAQHSVHERGVIIILKALIELDGRQCSVEQLAQRTNYSVKQAQRILKALSWCDDINPPLITSAEGRCGVPYRRRVNLQRVAELGVFDHAA